MRREREREHIAPPHSPTFLWKSSQTTAIGERHGRNERTSTLKTEAESEQRESERVRERGKEGRSMCCFGACQPDTGSSIKPAGRKRSAETRESCFHLLRSGSERPSPEELPAGPPERDHSV